MKWLNVEKIRELLLKIVIEYIYFNLFYKLSKAFVIDTSHKKMYVFVQFDTFSSDLNMIR